MTFTYLFREKDLNWDHLRSSNVIILQMVTDRANITIDTHKKMLAYLFGKFTFGLDPF